MKLESSYLFFIGLIILFASCTRVSFLYPVAVKKQDLIFKEQLLGQWMEKNKNDATVITIDTARSYDSALVYKISLIGEADSNFGDSSYLEGKLVNIGDRLFMMVYSDLEHSKIQQIGIYNAAMILPSYYFVRMFLIARDSLNIGQIDGDEFIDLIDKKKFSIKHEILQEDDYLVLEKGDNVAKKLIELDKFPAIYERTTYVRIK